LLILGSWANRLLAIDKVSWPAVSDGLLTIAIVDPVKQTAFLANSRRIPIVDYRALEKRPAQDDVPFVEITVFGISSPTERVTIEPAVSPPLDLPAVISVLPDPGQTKFLKGLLKKTHFHLQNKSNGGPF
jgi:hypothetical protein